MLTELLSSTAATEYPVAMTDGSRGAGRGGSTVDPMIRERIVAWMRYEMKRRGFESARAFAVRLHTSHTYVTRMLNGIKADLAGQDLKRKHRAA